MEQEDDSGLGWKFWIGIVGVALAVGLAGLILFAFFGWAWYHWGFLGTFLLFGGIAIGLAYLHDRREAKRRELLDA